MKGVLVVAHGNRAKDTEDAFTAVMNMMKEKLPGICVEQAFMAHGGRTIDEGIASLAAKGVTQITVAPYFLFSGGHVTESIPKIVNRCMNEYPGIKAVICEPLGVDERLAETLADRIKESK